MIESMEMPKFTKEKPKVSFVKRFFRYFGILTILVIVTILVLLLIAVIRALSVKPILQIDDIDAKFNFPEDRLQYMTSLFAESLRFKTVARSPHDYDRQELLKMHSFLKQKFGFVFNSSFIKWETVNNYSLLFTIQGQDATLSPYLLASHLDVVPVQAEEWAFDPFLGRIIHDPQTGEEVVWGRGAIDDKSGVMGILSAMEFLLESGWMPRRTFFIAFGHDEEVTGDDGAGHIAKLLESKGIELDFILDEGMPMTTGIFPGMETPVAIIGVAEKGWMNVKLVAEGTGGHSSIPPKDQAIETLSRAISRIYDYPQPSMYGTGPEKDMLRYLAYKSAWPHKLVYSNLWLFSPIINYVYSQSRASNAIIRTTTAVTMYSGGIKINVIPTKATATINHRIHPGQDLHSVLEFDKSVISDDRIQVTMLEGREPHPISPYGSDAPVFRLVASVIKHIAPDVVTVPGTLLENSDSRHYSNISKKIYRLNPYILSGKQLEKIHGYDELLPTSSFHFIIKFYVHLVMSSDAPTYESELDGTNFMHPKASVSSSNYAS